MTPATNTTRPADESHEVAAHANDATAVELLEQLVATPSVSGDELRAVTLLVDWMHRLGYRATIDDAGNAVGAIGSDAPDAQEIVLLGHIDTVPGDIPVRIDRDLLHGRGAVDAKGPLATFVMAGARAADAARDANVRLTVIGAVGEESTESPGATFVRKQRISDRQPIACIIGEPSAWDRYTIGYKGRLLVEATFRVPCGHSAGPNDTAAERAVAWWQRISTWTSDLNRDRSGAFNCVQSTLQAFNTTSDGMIDRAVALVGFRLPPGIEPADIAAGTRSLVDDAEVQTLGAVRAVRSERTNPVARAVAAAIASENGRPRPVVKTGTSDMNTVAGVDDGWTCPIIAYGPGDSSLDHTPHEHIHLSEYTRAIRVLAVALHELAIDHAAQDAPHT